MSLMNDECSRPMRCPLCVCVGVVWLLIDELMRPLALIVASVVVVVGVDDALVVSFGAVDCIVSLIASKLGDACQSLAVLGDVGVNLDALSTDDDRELAVVEPLL